MINQLPARGSWGFWGTLGRGAYAGSAISTLASAAAAQIEYASLGYKLTSVSAETGPSEMYVSASNTTGAYYKTAYWLATAARIAQSQNKASMSLISAASGNFARAGSLSLAILHPLSWGLVSGNEDVSDIQSVFLDGAAAAETGGVAEVARILRNLATAGAIQRQQSATEGDQLISDAPRRWLGLSSWKPIAVVGLAVGVASVGLAYRYRREIGQFFRYLAQLAGVFAKAVI